MADTTPPGPSTATPSLDPEWLAQRFHAVYEQMAPAFAYTTRTESAVPWEEVPRRNKALMRAVAALVEEDLRDRIAGEVQLTAMVDVEWLRKNATDDVDRARLIGAEDAYRAAIRTIKCGDDQ